MDFLDNLEMPAWLAYSITGAVVLGFIYWKFRDEIFFPFRHKKVNGRITNWVSINERGIRYFHPLIEFTTLRGQSIKVRAKERCEGAPMYEPGTVVEVRYLENDPDYVKIVYPKA
ncbi:MAG: DUF3592 domain-containing protein [Flavobacteriales bacterium]